MNTTPSSVAVKNEWRYTSVPSLCLHGMDRENFCDFYVTYFVYIKSVRTSG